MLSPATSRQRQRPAATPRRAARAPARPSWAHTLLQSVARCADAVSSRRERACFSQSRTVRGKRASRGRQKGRALCDQTYITPPPNFVRTDAAGRNAAFTPRACIDACVLLESACMQYSSAQDKIWLRALHRPTASLAGSAAHERQRRASRALSGRPTRSAPRTPWRPAERQPLRCTGCASVTVSMAALSSPHDAIADSVAHPWGWRA